MAKKTSRSATHTRYGFPCNALTGTDNWHNHGTPQPLPNSTRVITTVFRVTHTGTTMWHPTTLPNYIYTVPVMVPVRPSSMLCGADSRRAAPRSEDTETCAMSGAGGTRRGGAIRVRPRGQHRLPRRAWPSSKLQVEQYLVGSVLDRLADELHNHRAVARALAVEGPRLVLHLCTTAHAARVRAESTLAE